MCLFPVGCLDGSSSGDLKPHSEGAMKASTWGPPGHNCRSGARKWMAWKDHSGQVSAPKVPTWTLAGLQWRESSPRRGGPESFHSMRIRAADLPKLKSSQPHSDEAMKASQKTHTNTLTHSHRHKTFTCTCMMGPQRKKETSRQQKGEEDSDIDGDRRED